MRTTSLLAGALLLALASTSVSTATLSAQAPDPTIAAIKTTYDMVKGYVTKAAAQVPEDKYKYQPTKEVRTMGALFGHIADANNLICGTAAGTPPAGQGGAEKLATKAELQKALADSFAACDKAFTAVTAKNMNESVTLFGQLKLTRLAALSFNVSHDMEHYGNLVTYMRINGMVPPSSGGGGN